MLGATPTETGTRSVSARATGLVGADIEWERALAGVVLSHSAGDGDFNGDGAIAGDIDSTLSGIYPYGRVDFTGSTSVWAIAGGGWGDVTIEPEGGTRVHTGASMRMGEDGGLAVNVRTDAMWVRTETEPRKASSRPKRTPRG